MYALSAGCGSFRRRPFSASPCPPLAAARVGGRARSRVPGVPPRRLPPFAPGARRAVSAQGACPCGGSAALALRSASRPSAPPLPFSARVSGALWGVLAPLRLGLAPRRAGAAVPPLPAPFGGSLALAPPGGLPGAAAPRLFVRSCAPPGLGLVLPRCGSAHLRRSLSPPGKLSGFCPALPRRGACALLFIEQAEYLQKIRRAYILSCQDKKPRKLNKI